MHNVWKEKSETSGVEKGQQEVIQEIDVLVAGLYDNIHKKRARIARQKAAGKKPEKMRSPGAKGAPTAKAFKRSAKTAKKK